MDAVVMTVATMEALWLVQARGGGTLRGLVLALQVRWLEVVGTRRWKVQRILVCSRCCVMVAATLLQRRCSCAAVVRFSLLLQYS